MSNHANRYENNNPGLLANIYDAIDDFFYNTRKGKVIYKILVFAISVFSIWLSIWLTSKYNNYQEKLEVIRMLNQLVTFQNEGIEKNASQYERYSDDRYRTVTDCVSLSVYREVINNQKVRNFLDETAYANIHHFLDIAEYTEGYIYSENATSEGKIQAIKARDYTASEINELILASSSALENKTDHDTICANIHDIINKYADGFMDFPAY